MNSLKFIKETCCIVLESPTAEDYTDYRFLDRDLTFAEVEQASIDMVNKHNAYPVAIDLSEF